METRGGTESFKATRLDSLFHVDFVILHEPVSVNPPVYQHRIINSNVHLKALLGLS